MGKGESRNMEKMYGDRYRTTLQLSGEAVRELDEMSIKMAERPKLRRGKSAIMTDAILHFYKTVYLPGGF